MIYVWILGLTSTNLFVLGSLTGLIISPLYPLSFGWFNQKLNVIPSLLAMLCCGSAFGSLIVQKVAGRLLLYKYLSCIFFVDRNLTKKILLYVLGFVMDRDPNHFPTLLTVIIILPIILHIISNVITFFHERKLRNRQHPIKNDIPLSREHFGEEEQQLTNYLKDDNEKQ
jgi:hypothetical protein